MAHIKATVTLNMTVGMPEDAPVNTWHFQGTNDAAGRDIIYTSLVDFYDTMRLELSGRVSQNDHRIKMYLMEDPEPRAPIRDQTFNLTSAPSGGPQAAEVALCLSFQGDRVSGEEQRSRRGRIYFGPLDTTVVDSDGRPSSAFVTKLAGAGGALIDSIANDVSSTMLWVVYSPTTSALVPVTNGWVDNSFDTVRRRGLAPTLRTTFTE
jgi:hypothetical protein